MIRCDMCLVRGSVIVMEFLEHDLLSFLANSTSAVIASTLPKVFKELIEGLECLHSKMFLHRYVSTCSTYTI